MSHSVEVRVPQHVTIVRVASLDAELVPDPAVVRAKLKLLYLSCGNKDGLIGISQGVHAYLKEKGVGVILINVAFQLGFCTFVLSNYMKALQSGESSVKVTIDADGTVMMDIDISWYIFATLLSISSRAVWFCSCASSASRSNTSTSAPAISFSSVRRPSSVDRSITTDFGCTL